MGETDDQGEMPGTITTHEYVVCSRRRSPCKLGRMRHLAFIALVTIDQVVDQTNYLLGDHLGGTNVTDRGTDGVELGRVLYRPWGETRVSTGTTPTTWRFTGQREDATIGLYFYNARYLDPQLGRFISADSVVQGNAREPGVVLPLVVSYANPRVLAQMNDFQRGVGQAFAAFDPQLLNRYAYARNNPLAYRDDSGHVVWWVVGGIVGGVVGFGAYALTHQDNLNWKEAALWTGGGTVVGATFGAGAQFVAGALGTQTTLTTVVTTAGASASSPGGARIIHWLEQNTNRVQHILASKHAWDRLGNLSGNLVQDYRLIQPFIQQTINSGVGRQIDVTPKGPLLEFMATINGQQVVVRVIQLANNAFEISNAWVKTP